METLFYQSPSNNVDDLLSHKLQKKLNELQVNEFSAEELRKAIQLAILKGMQRTTQPNHLMTPEAVALFIGYLAKKLTKDQPELSVFDPVCGTANLLTIVLSQLKNPSQSYGSEIDTTLIRLALYNANLQKKNIEFFHQDSLRPFLLDPVDIVVADLPVGYYPDDDHAKSFELKAEQGHSYAHHLFIEQSLNYSKEGAYLFFLVPEFLFDSDQAEQLNSFIHKHAHIVGVIRLPENAFRSKKNVKSIFIIQKKGEGTKAPQQPSLAMLP